MTSRAAAVLLTSLALVGVSGCTTAAGPEATPSRAPTTASGAEGSSSAPSPTPSPTPVVVDGLGLAILQNRPDYGDRRLQLSVTNEGAAPITVTAARFTSPQFAADAEFTRATEVPAGLTRYLPVLLPEAVCPTPGTAPTLTVTVTEASGASRDVSASPADPFGVLERIAGEDCLDDAVAAVAAVRLDDALEVVGSGADAVAHLRLQVEPVASGAGTLRLDRIASTILLQPAGGDDWPLGTTVRPGDDPVVLEFEAVPARCDPHAVAEDKRGTFLPVSVEIGGVESGSDISGTLSVRSSDALRLAIYDFIAERCGFAVPVE